MNVLDQIVKLILREHEWWHYLIAVVIPICILITIREFMCWFWKINKLVSRLDRIEQRLNYIRATSRPAPQQATQTATQASSEDYTLD